MFWFYCPQLSLSGTLENFTLVKHVPAVSYIYWTVETLLQGDKLKALPICMMQSTGLVGMTHSHTGL